VFAFTEIAFGLTYLTTQDAAAYNCASSFNYAQAPLGPSRLTLSPVSAAELHAVAKTPPDPSDPT